jgi:membrane dipeptidase
LESPAGRQSNLGYIDKLVLEGLIARRANIWQGAVMSKLRAALPPTLVLLLAATFCSEAAENISDTNFLSKVTPEAWRIHRRAIVIDGHNDLPYEMRAKANLSFDNIDLSKRATNLQTDIPRLKLGGMGAQFWAAYVPADLAVKGGAAHQTLEQIDLIHRMVARYPETFAFARSADDILKIHKSGRIACLIGIEGGHSIENSIALLRMYYDLGVRYMTLTHSDSLDWADSATDKPKTANGLSDFGRDVVREMNRLGMLVDISHVSTNTMNAALDVTRAPIIASHSSAYAVAQHARNVPDDVLLRIKANGGVVMVNFFSGFVVPEGARVMRDMFEVDRELRQKFPNEKDHSAAMDQWRKEHPMPSGTAKDVVDHIDHIVKIAGIDHVGLGGDFDGVPQTPTDLPDVSGYPVITQELLNRHYSENDIKKILGGNLLRAFAEAEKVAKKLH